MEEPQHVNSVLNEFKYLTCDSHPSLRMFPGGLCQTEVASV